MWVRVSPWGIIRDHLSTLRGDGTARAAQREKFWFFVAPLVPCLALFYTKTDWSKLIDAAIAALAILAGLLFNLLILLFSQRANRSYERVDATDLSQVNRARDEVDALRESYHNTSFSIIVSLGAILLFVLAKLDLGLVSGLFLAGAVWCCLIFILTLMMILNRVQTLFAIEAGNAPPPPYKRPEPTPIGPGRSAAEPVALNAETAEPLIR
jgi:hypothetical protein